MRTGEGKEPRSRRKVFSAPVRQSLVSSSVAMTTLLDLPTDLLGEIASLDTTDVFPVVCSVFSKVHQHVPRQLDFHSPTKKREDAIVHHTFHALTLDVSHDDAVLWQLLDQSGFTPARPRFPGVRKLRITNPGHSGGAIANSCMLASLVNLNRVQRMRLDGVKPDSVLDFIDPETCALSELDLCMRNEDYELPRATTRRLTKLSVSATKITGYRGAFGPNLRVLRLVDSTDSLLANLDDIAEKCPDIQRIHGVLCDYDAEYPTLKARHPRVYRALMRGGTCPRLAKTIEDSVSPGQYVPRLLASLIPRFIRILVESEVEQLLDALLTGRMKLRPDSIQEITAELRSGVAYDVAAPFISTFAPPTREDGPFWRWTHKRCYTLLALIGRSYVKYPDRICALIRHCLTDRRTAPTVGTHLLRAAVGRLDIWIDGGPVIQSRDTVYPPAVSASCAMLLMLPLETDEKAHIETLADRGAVTAVSVLEGAREVMKYTCEATKGRKRLLALCEDS